MINLFKKKTMVIILTMILVPYTLIWATETNTKKITDPLKKSIQTRQKSQKELDKWEKERIKLQATYEQLQIENQQLLAQKQMLIKQESSQKALNEKLLAQKKDSIRITQEMMPFIENAYMRLNNLISNDAPFLKDERHKRLQNLRKIIDAIDVTVAEKFRKIMEALFVEAEYGNTVEVYQEKVVLDENELLGNIFRLGRISLFFLTLDQSSAAFYSVNEKKWISLDNIYVPTIHAAIEMALKRRPVELLPLPVGRIAVQ
ncbi:Uncharacterized conserved protein UCP028069 [Candidatus Magnetomorum sp. HK-1]|nr:Uncharacterized conserved protein UCP028069 [Candidatus Magnetomorum sp. HK-1]